MSAAHLTEKPKQNETKPQMLIYVTQIFYLNSKVKVSFEFTPDSLLK